MARVDPEFGPIDMRTYNPQKQNPSPFVSNPGYRGDSPPPPKPAQLALWDRVRQEVAEEVEKAPTPVSDTLGEIKVNKPPSRAVLGEKYKEIETEYGWTGGWSYIERASPPGGNWDGGYGLNAFAALKRLEKQLSFFKLNGKTPLEVAVDRYNETSNKEMKEENLKRRVGKREEELKGLFGGKKRRKTQKSKKISRRKTKKY